MGNWIPGDPTLVAQILRICGAYAPPPPEGFISPMTWGDEAAVRQRFETAGIAPKDIRFDRMTWYFRQPGAPTNLFETFRDYYGPTMNAFASADKAGRAEELEKELIELFVSQNRGGASTEIPATYLKVSVNKG
jgi:hypothetical protein